MGLELLNFNELAKTYKNGQITFPQGEGDYSIYINLGNEKLRYHLNSSRDTVYNISYKNQYIEVTSKKFGIFTERRLTTFKAFKTALKNIRAKPKK